MVTKAVSVSLVLVAAVFLGGCSAADDSAPPVADPGGGSIVDEPTPSTSEGAEEDGEVCSLGALPASAVIRMCAIAVAPGGTRAQVVLTVDEPTVITAASEADRTALETGCANTIIDAGWVNTASGRIVNDATFLTATLDVQGVDWPTASVLYVGFGSTFHWAAAPNVTSPNDSVSLGCFEPITFGGAGTARLVGLADAFDYNGGVDNWLQYSSFGFGEIYSSRTGVTFEDCTIELSAHAAAHDDLWLSPEEWGTGCVTGYLRDADD
jgi:hypothetical protein